MENINELEIENFKKSSAAIRGLVLDFIYLAKSGYAGLPLGCAEIGAYLYGYLFQ